MPGPNDMAKKFTFSDIPTAEKIFDWGQIANAVEFYLNHDLSL